MNIKADFILQLLQKLGAPLMQAVNRHSSGNSEADAKTMASLLSESVKISISLSQAMNIKDQDGDTDAIRVGLAALAAGLVADFYSHSGRLPKDSDVDKISSTLQSVIVFADNFAPAAEHSKRLKTLDGTPPFFDSVQSNIYGIHALLPTMAAIGEFSFGQQDTKLIQDVAQKLRAQAKDILTKFSDESNSMSELVALKALSQIYASAHKSEVRKLQSTSETPSSESSMAAIWENFGKQVSMVEAVLGGASGSDQPSSSGSSSKAPGVSVPSQEEMPAPPPAAQSTGASPMAFFKKK